MSCAENRGTPTSLRGTPSVTAPHGLRPGRRRQGAAGPGCRVPPTRLGCRRGADGARTGRGRGAGGTCCGGEAWRWVGTGMLLSGKGFLRPTAPPCAPGRPRSGTRRAAERTPAPATRASGAGRKDAGQVGEGVCWAGRRRAGQEGDELVSEDVCWAGRQAPAAGPEGGRRRGSKWWAQGSTATSEEGLGLGRDLSHTHTRMRTHAYRDTHVYTNAHVHSHTHITCVHTQAHLRMFTHANIRTETHALMCTHMHTCTPIYVYTHGHRCAHLGTYTH